MTEMKIVFNDGNELSIDTYQFDPPNKKVIFSIFSPENADLIIDNVYNFDCSKFTLIANYPGGKKREIHFINYYFVNSFVKMYDKSSVLEILFKKI